MGSGAEADQARRDREGMLPQPRRVETVHLAPHIGKCRLFLPGGFARARDGTADIIEL